MRPYPYSMPGQSWQSSHFFTVSTVAPPRLACHKQARRSVCQRSVSFITTRGITTAVASALTAFTADSLLMLAPEACFFLITTGSQSCMIKIREFAQWMWCRVRSR